MITFKKTQYGGVINFDDSDIRTIQRMVERALNTWQPNPPPDLLNILKQIDALK